MAPPKGGALKEEVQPDDESTENPLAKSKEPEPAKEAWMDEPEDDIYRWCWQAVAATGIGTQMLRLHEDSNDESVRSPHPHTHIAASPTCQRANVPTCERVDLPTCEPVIFPR